MKKRKKWGICINFYLFLFFAARGVLRRARAVPHTGHKSVGTDRCLLLAHRLRANGRGASADVRQDRIECGLDTGDGECGVTAAFCKNK